MARKQTDVGPLAVPGITTTDALVQAMQARAAKAPTAKPAAPPRYEYSQPLAIEGTNGALVACVARAVRGKDAKDKLGAPIAPADRVVSAFLVGPKDAQPGARFGAKLEWIGLASVAALSDDAKDAAVRSARAARWA